jgi:hypothetical protein
MKNYNFIVLIVLIFTGFSCKTETQKKEVGIQKGRLDFRDIYPDTWVASDALGRTMPSFEEVGSIKKDQRRITGIFYITWHTQDNTKLAAPYAANVTEILRKDPSARFDAHHELWKD